MTAAAGTMAIKVTVGDTWMPRTMAVAPTDTVAEVKAKALAAERIAPAEHHRYEVKVGGAVVRDESRTLAASGIRSGAPVVILARFRRPVR